MSAIVAIAYEEVTPSIEWHEFHFGGRLVPVHILPGLLPSFERWSNYVRPIVSEGHLIGLWVSNLMTRRAWKRLRKAAEPLLVSQTEAPTREEPAEEHTNAYVLSLAKHGLHIPARSVDRAREVLAQLGDIGIAYDEDDEERNAVSLIIPRGVPLAGLLELLEVDVEPIQPVSPSAARELMNRLRDEIRKLDKTARPTTA